MAKTPKIANVRDRPKTAPNIQNRLQSTRANVRFVIAYAKPRMPEFVRTAQTESIKANMNDCQTHKLPNGGTIRVTRAVQPITMQTKPFNPHICGDHDDAEIKFAQRSCPVCAVQNLTGTRLALEQSDEQLRRAEQLLEELGYRRCNVAACNCDGYHQQTPEPEL